MDQPDLKNLLPSYIRVSKWLEQRPPGPWGDSDPGLFGPTKEPYQSIWASTCRVITNTGVGSGFFVNLYGHYVVTCAHVVDRAGSITVERPLLGGAVFEQWPAQLVSIDYSHDLAIVTITDPRHTALGARKEDRWNKVPICKLDLAPAPNPGESVIICGFPEGVDNPRLATGLVSGYDSVEVGRVSIHAVALDAAVNRGNSGGPVCNSDGKVVGVVFARPNTLKVSDAALKGVSKKLIAILCELNANNGIGYALDPRDVNQLLTSYLEFNERVYREFRKYPPRTVALPKDCFVDLQVECRDRGLSPVGVFSFGKDFVLYHGWSTDEHRTRLTAAGWRDCLHEISYDGGSFLLRGYEVLLYRRTYRGFVVPVVLSLV